MKPSLHLAATLLILLLPVLWARAQQAEGTLASSLSKEKMAEERNAIVTRSALGRCFNRAPPYPKDALRNGQAGQTILVFHVSPEGLLQEPEILRASGYETLDKAALAHLTSCIASFRSSSKDPLPAGRYVFPITWRPLE